MYKVTAAAILVASLTLALPSSVAGEDSTETTTDMRSMALGNAAKGWNLERAVPYAELRVEYLENPLVPATYSRLVTFFEILVAQDVCPSTLPTYVGYEDEWETDSSAAETEWAEFLAKSYQDDELAVDWDVCFFDIGVYRKIDPQDVPAIPTLSLELYFGNYYFRDDIDACGAGCWTTTAGEVKFRVCFLDNQAAQLGDCWTTTCGGDEDQTGGNCERGVDLPESTNSVTIKMTDRDPGDDDHIDIAFDETTDARTLGLTITRAGTTTHQSEEDCTYVEYGNACTYYGAGDDYAEDRDGEVSLTVR